MPITLIDTLKQSNRSANVGTSSFFHMLESIDINFRVTGIQTDATDPHTGSAAATGERWVITDYSARSTSYFDNLTCADGDIVERTGTNTWVILVDVSNTLPANDLNDTNEGILVYAKDKNLFYFYNGSAWVAITDTDTNTTYSAATTSALGLMKLEDDTEQSVAANTVSATAGRTYGVQFNSSDQAVVNVPWTDTDTNTTYSAATALALGLMKLEDDTTQTTAANTVTTTAGRTYGVQFNSSGQAVVNVPWADTDTNTTYSAANSSVLGLVKLEDDTTQTTAANTVSTTAGRTYGVQLNSSNQAVVNVPWDTAAITALNDATENELVTVASSVTQLDAEANLTFNGTTLELKSGGATKFQVAGSGHVTSESGATFKGNSFVMGDSGDATNFIHATGATNLNFRNDNDSTRLQFDYPAVGGSLFFRSYNQTTEVAVDRIVMDSDGLMTPGPTLCADSNWNTVTKVATGSSTTDVNQTEKIYLLNITSGEDGDLLRINSSASALDRLAAGMEWHFIVLGDEQVSAETNSSSSSLSTQVSLDDATGFAVGGKISISTSPAIVREIASIALNVITLDSALGGSGVISGVEVKAFSSFRIGAKKLTLSGYSTVSGFETGVLESGSVFEAHGNNGYNSGDPPGTDHDAPNSSRKEIRDEIFVGSKMLINGQVRTVASTGSTQSDSTHDKYTVSGGDVTGVDNLQVNYWREKLNGEVGGYFDIVEPDIIYTLLCVKVVASTATNPKHAEFLLSTRTNNSVTAQA